MFLESNGLSAAGETRDDRIKHEKEKLIKIAGTLARIPGRRSMLLHLF